jgi:hypothetical protein
VEIFVGFDRCSREDALFVVRIFGIGVVDRNAAPFPPDHPKLTGIAIVT